MTAASSAGARHRLLIVFGGFVALGLYSATFGAVWPELRRTFGQPVSALTWVALASTVGYSLASAASGRVVGRAGLALTLAVASVVVAAAMLGQAADRWWLVVPVLSMVGGAAGGFIDTASNTYVATYHGVRAMGVLHAMFGVGAVLSPLLLSAVLQLGFSWRPVFAVAGVLFLVVAVLITLERDGWGGRTAAGGDVVAGATDGDVVARAVDGGRIVHAEADLAGEASVVVPDDVPSGTMRASTVVASSTPRVALGVAFFVANVAFELTIGQWGSSFLREVRHVPRATTARWVAGFWATFTVARISLGWVTAKLGEWRVLDLSIGAALAGAFGILLVPDALGAGLGMLVCGVGIAAMFPMHTSLTVRRVGADRAGTVIGYQVAAAGVGSALQAAVLGWIAATVGLRAFGPALVAIGIVMAVLERLVRRAALRAPARRPP